MSFLGAQNSIALGVQGLIHIDTGGGAGGSADYLLAKSLRFRSSASAYLDRTPAVAGNQKTWTWSGWVKRGTLGSAQAIFAEAVIGYATYFTLFFESDNTIGFDGDFAGTRVSRKTASVFRDPSAWYHVVLVLDTTQATDTNRVLMYVNGVINSFSTVISGTWPAQNTNGGVNAAQTHNIGRRPIDNDRYCDLDLAEVNFVDGQALAPTAFGAYSIYNQWLPIKYAGTYGTNGFYLPFTNTASTSTLVADSSGNNNNWTPNNISLAAGSTYDSLTDVPTLTSETVANYAVLNPLNALGSATASSGNLNFSVQSASNSAVFSTIACSGKNYFEEKGLSFGTSSLGIVCLTNVSGISGVIYYTDGRLYVNNSLQGTYVTWSSGDTMACDVDTATRQIRVYKNNTQIGSTGTATGTDPLFFGIAGSGVGVGAGSGSVNFGQQPFVYTAPSGFLPLNTFNI